ncbi:MAG: exosortase/archaeosortase family protein [Aureliella sp.]
MDETRRQSWWLVSTLVFLAFVAARHVWFELLLGSGGDAASTAYLAFAVAAYLIWHHKEEFRFGKRFNPWGMTTLAVGAMTLWCCSTQDVLYGERLGAALLLWGVLMAFAHPARLRAVFSVGAVLVLFAIGLPGTLGSYLTLPLASANATLVGYVLTAFGHESEVLGTLVVSGDFELQVVDACDGLRLLWAVVLLSIAQLVPRDVPRRTTFIVLACAPVIALMLNSARVLLASVLFAEVPESAAELVHDATGWAMMAGAWLLPAGLIWGMEVGRESSAPMGFSSQLRKRHEPVGLLRWSAVALMLIGLSTGLQSEAPTVTRSEFEQEAKTVFNAVPYRFEDFIGVEELLPERQLAVLKPDASIGMRFESQDRMQHFKLILTMHENGRSHRGHQVERCYRNLGWKVKRTQTSSVQRPFGTVDTTVCHLERERLRRFEGMVVYKASFNIEFGNGKVRESATGLLQLQLLFPADFEIALRKRIVDACMGRIRGALLQVEQGYPNSDLVGGNASDCNRSISI